MGWGLVESSGFKPKLAHCNKAIISHFTVFTVYLCYKWLCNYTENIKKFKSNICTYCRASVCCKCHNGEERKQWHLFCTKVTAISQLLFQITHTFSFLSPGKICKGWVKEMFVNMMCKAESNGICMLNRPSLRQANQVPLRKWENMVGAQTPGTKTHSPSLTSLLISLSALTQLYQDNSRLCIWNHQNQSSILFVSLSTFSLAETNKGSPNPAANVLLLDG